MALKLECFVCRTETEQEYSDGMVCCLTCDCAREVEDNEKALVKEYENARQVH